MKYLSTYYDISCSSPITSHLTWIITPDDFAYYGICTSYPNHQILRWGRIKDLTFLDNKNKITFKSNIIRAPIITFLIAFGSIKDSFPKIEIVVEENFKEVLDLSKAEDVQNRINQLKKIKQCELIIRNQEFKDIEIFQYLNLKLRYYARNFKIRDYIQM